jgi:hypothetical protein
MARRAAHATTRPDSRAQVERDPLVDDGPTVPHPSPGAARRAARARAALPLAAAALALVALTGFLSWPAPPPERAARELRVGERWDSPFGVTFTLRHARDASIGMVSRAELQLDVRRGDKTETIALGQALTIDHVAHGVPFRVTRRAQLTPVRQVHIDAGASLGGPAVAPAAARDGPPASAPDGPPPLLADAQAPGVTAAPPPGALVPPLEVERPPDDAPTLSAEQTGAGRQGPIPLTKEPARKKKKKGKRAR